MKYGLGSVKISILNVMFRQPRQKDTDWAASLTLQHFGHQTRKAVTHSNNELRPRRLADSSWLVVPAETGLELKIIHLCLLCRTVAASVEARLLC